MTTPPPVPVERTATCAGCGADVRFFTCSMCQGRLCFDCCEKARASHVIDESPKPPAEPATECSTTHSPFLDLGISKINLTTNQLVDELVQRIIRDREIAVRNALTGQGNLYLELLYAVARVFPGESRHDTALRYIREAEDRAVESEPKDATPIL